MIAEWVSTAFNNRGKFILQVYSKNEKLEFITLCFSDAQVAKLVDALCSGRSVRKDVLVRIQSWAQRPRNLLRGFLFW
jgi:hypothetical protein